jgi:hypothetical protein
MSVTWRVTVYTAAGEVTGEARDLTSSGAYIECSELNETNWPQIRVFHCPLMLKGKVIWCNLITDKTGIEVSHAGIFFIQIEDEDRHVLRDAILEGEE